jgi:hypothetical protein
MPKRKLNYAKEKVQLCQEESPTIPKKKIQTMSKRKSNPKRKSSYAKEKETRTAGEVRNWPYYCKTENATAVRS